MIVLKRKSYIMKNISDIKKLNKSALDRYPTPLVQDTQIAPLMARKPGDPILNSYTRPFEVASIMNLFDNLQSRMQTHENN